MASQNFIDELKYGANSNRLGKFTIGSTLINESQLLNEMTIKDSIYNNGKILGGVFDRTLDATLVNKPDTLDLESKTVSDVAIGVKYSDETTEYEEFDDFVIETIKDAETNSVTSFTAYGSGANLDEVYNCTLNFEGNTTHTIYEFYADVCTQLGLTPTDQSITNGNIVMTGNPFTNGESCRVVLEEVEKVSCSFIDISWKDKTITLKWFSDTLDYEFNPSDYSILEGSLSKFGPVNVVIIGNSQITGENVAKQDDESIALNGETQVMIDEPYFLYTQDLRAQAINGIFSKINGFQYYDLSLLTPYGKPFLRVGNKIRINTPDNKVYDTYVLTHELTYNGTIKSTISSPALTKEEQKVKNQVESNSIRGRLQRTEVSVDKINGQITSLTEKTDQLEDSIEVLKPEVDTNVIVISAYEKKPYNTKTYTIPYSCKYLGETITLQPSCSDTHTGITMQITNSVITFSVNSNVEIPLEENKYTFTWTKTDPVSGDTFTATRIIMINVVSSDVEQTVVIGNTAPSDTSLIWYDTVDASLKSYVNGTWQIIDDDSNEIARLKQETESNSNAINGTVDFVATEDTEFIENKDYYELIDSEYVLYEGTKEGSPAEKGLYERVEIIGLNQKYIDLNTELESKVNESQVQTISQTITNQTIQTQTYTKQQIQKIIDGEGFDGQTVTAVVGIEATFDENGMTYEKTNADTSSRINQDGLKIEKINRSQGITTKEETLFAGYVTDNRFGTQYYHDTIVYTHNLVSKGYTEVGEHGRFESYDGPNGEDGTGFFLV